MNIKLTNPNATVPTRGSTDAAGYDLYACEPRVVYPGATMKVNTGIAVEIPKGYFGAVFARSGLATKQGLRPANCVGVIDADYRGDVMVALYNDSTEPREVQVGDRIAQLVIIPYISPDLEVVSDLSDTERSGNGFGSTGK
jgi:dUTP pyrophosphatase